MTFRCADSELPWVSFNTLIRGDKTATLTYLDTLKRKRKQKKEKERERERERERETERGGCMK